MIFVFFTLGSRSSVVENSQHITPDYKFLYVFVFVLSNLQGKETKQIQYNILTYKHCYLYLYKYENVCLFVCSRFSRPFRNRLGNRLAQSISIFLLDLSVNLKSNYRKTKGGRNLILFAKKLASHREKFTGNVFPKSGQLCVMPVCLK